jgi:glycosyltransferase involved in cell wall biosynthesis
MALRSKDMSRIYIGMPSYNSSDFIASAIESLLNQTFRDFRLIISDNASTDDTVSIAYDYQRRDSRITVIKQPANIGAMENFRYLLSQASSDYFMWAGSHDNWSRNYLQSLIERLEGNHLAVLCYAKLGSIDTLGQPVQGTIADCFSSIDERPELRVSKIVGMIQSCHMIYGLIRTKDLKMCRLRLKCIGPDHVVLAELSLRGQIIYCPDALLYMRRIREDPEDQVEFRRGQLTRILGKLNVEKELKDCYRKWWLQHMLSCLNPPGSILQKAINAMYASNAFISRWPYQMPRCLRIPYRLAMLYSGKR